MLDKKSVYAGILIGIGDIVNLSVVNKYVGATLFSLGLLTILQCNLNLYTGKVGYYDRYTLKDLMPILFCNLIGISYITLICGIAKPEILYFMQTSTKFDSTFYDLFFLGMLCGICMYVAASAKNQLITVLAVMVFILSGFEHSIASFPFLIMNFSFENILKFICILAGNTVGAMSINWLNREKGTQND